MANRGCWSILVFLLLLASCNSSSVPRVQAVNDISTNHKPKFHDCTHYEPTLRKEQPTGTPVLRVTASDPDQGQTLEYSIATMPEDQNYFNIDKTTGQIVSAHVFDRDAPIRDREINITVRATDNGSPSLADVCTIKVTILDINDDPSIFHECVYEVSVTKDLPLNQSLATISAVDLDDDDNNRIKYEIVQEHEDSSYFDIDESNGLLTLAKPNDRSPGQFYTIHVRAYSEGSMENQTQQTKVMVRVLDPNDHAPYFIKMPMVPVMLKETFQHYNMVLAEYEAVSNVKKDDFVDFQIVQGNTDLTFLLDQINNTVVYIKLRSSLDYERTTNYTLVIRATNSLNEYAEVCLMIMIVDENDNYPVLDDNTGTILEHELPGTFVMQVHARDDDGTAPNNIVSYRLADTDRQYFQIDSQTGIITSMVKFDREKEKAYVVSVTAEDNAPSVKFKNGSPNSVTNYFLIKVLPQSEKGIYENTTISTKVIVVYKYKGKTSDIDIGHAHVNDPDGLDLSNKTFLWDEVTSEESLKLFQLNFSTGMITMLEATPCGQYDLRFQVVQNSGHLSRHNVSARATVLVKEVSEQSIDQSGSIRFYNVTADEFISQTPEHRSTPLHRLQTSIATVLNVSSTDVDIFTVNNRKVPKLSFLDVFFAVNGSVYSTSEVLNGVLSYQLHQLEEDVGFPIEVVGIDECELQSSTCEQSCRNKVHKSAKPIVVYGNATSFIGITTFVEAECVSDTPLITCFNGGTLESNSCICPNGFEGPQCELIDISFDGNGYAIYPSIIGGTISNISIEMLPQRTDGLVLYIGPMSYNPRVKTQPFLALEIIDSMAVLLLDYGTGTFRIQDQQIFSQYDLLRVDISLKPETIEMNTLKNKVAISNSRYKNKDFGASIKTHGPVQLGGTIVDFTKLGSLYNWTHIPQTKGFNGNLRTLTINGRTIDFQQHNLAQNLHSSQWPFERVTTIFAVLFTIIIILGVLSCIHIGNIVSKKNNNKGVKKTTNQNSQPLLNNNKTSIGIPENDSNKMPNYENHKASEPNVQKILSRLYRVYYTTATSSSSSNGNRDAGRALAAAEPAVPVPPVSLDDVAAEGLGKATGPPGSPVVVLKVVLVEPPLDDDERPESGTKIDTC
ncbi:DE-cadherin-like [Anopheles marshallii]|uniref:DE-cadherin-like n=1 Tax=Anopheles marshallii TaxID=1521116 RepID=UPI00237B7A77|nr:DE-cadherin-like [Anopheles marshallii]